MFKPLRIIILLSALIVFASCSTSSQNGGNGMGKNPLGMSDEDYTAFLDTSLLSAGNNYRLKGVLAKAKAGDKINIAAIGGSVTEGEGPRDYHDGYAYQFAEKFKSAFTPDDGANVVFDGAGLSGTPSTLGLVRYQSDVVDVLGAVPDILVIEFAVNDGGEPTQSRAFESLIRTALTQSESTAVIVLYAAAEYPNTQPQMKGVAEHYLVPEVSISDAVRSPLNNGVFTNEQFFTDTVHPTADGHELMADCLINLLKKADAAPADEPAAVPDTASKTPDFFNFTRITPEGDDNVKITAGGFSSVDPKCQSIKKTGGSNFPQNWYHAPSDSADSFVMEIDCKNLLFVYKENGSWESTPFGMAEAYVDGEFAGSFDGSNPNGWNNCVTQLLIDESESAKHTVEIRMKKGSESEGFTIVAMGYSR